MYGSFDIHEDTEKLKLYSMSLYTSGGFGQLYHYSNPPVTTGDGAAMAYRAGCKLMDLEFVQFHPTVLYHKENRSFSFQKQ